MLVRLGSVPGLLFFQSSISPSGGSSPGQVQMSNSWLAPLKSSLLLFLPPPEPPVNDGCQIWEWVRIHSGLFISARRCIHSFFCFSLIHSHERVCVKVWRCISELWYCRNLYFHLVFQRTVIMSFNMNMNQTVSFDDSFNIVLFWWLMLIGCHDKSRDTQLFFHQPLVTWSI